MEKVPLHRRDPAARIHLRILGPTELRGSDGQALLSILSQPKRLTLLAYLALTATGGFTRREKLLGLFWPDSDQEKARASLRGSLSFLRKSLGEGVVVTRGDEEVGIAAGVLECDAVRFGAALDQGELESAWELYGGPQLDGVHVSDAAPMERWLDDERSRLERRAVEAALTLADRAASGGDLDAAISWTRRALAQEPHSESGVRRLIGLLAQAGDREEAVHTYDRFVARLAEELELEPSAETQALIRSIRSTPAPTADRADPTTEPSSAPVKVGGRDARPTIQAPPIQRPTIQRPTDQRPTIQRPTDQGPAIRRPAYLRQISLATIALAAFTLVGVFWGSRRPLSPGGVTRHSVVMAQGEQMASVAGRRFAVSPDGSRFVYTGGPTRQLYVREFDQLRARSLPDTEGSWTPFFSPDGAKAGFFAQGELKLISLSGGPIVGITDAVDQWGGATWGSDGFIYASGAGFGGLVRFRSESGAVPQPFTRLDSESGETDHRWPDVRPAGGGILFTVLRARAGALGSERLVAVADPETGSHKILLEGMFARHAGPGHLIYVTADSTLMVAPFDSEAGEVTGPSTVVSPNQRVGFRGSVDVSVSETGTLMYGTGRNVPSVELVWVTRDGAAESLDPVWEGNLSFPTLSLGGSRIAVVMSGAETSDIWVGNVDGPGRQRLTEGAVDGYPAWTPDGRSVTYFSRSSGLAELWTKSADGSAQPVLQLSRPRDLVESLWSPDGKWLIYRTTNVPQPSLTESGASVRGAGDILAVQPGVVAEPISIATTRFAELSPALSPDGRWLAYNSDETGRSEVFVTGFPDGRGARWSVSPNGGTNAVWSHQTGELFYRNARGGLVAVEVETESAFATGRSTVLFDARAYVNDGLHQTYAVSPDGQRFLMLRRTGEPDPGELIVVENWFGELPGPPGSR